MTEHSAVHHLPAVKVGGRRLSISAKHKHHVAPEPALSGQNETSGIVSVPDYPRPAPPGDGQIHPPHNEEAPPKKEKKHDGHDDEKKLRELLQWKLESTRPTRDLQLGNKGFGAAGRIAQPAGKGLGV